MSEEAKKESVLKVLKSGVYLDGPDDPDFNDYGFVAPETEDLYRNYMENANAAIQLSNANQKKSKSNRQRKSTKKSTDEKRKVEKDAKTKLKKMKLSSAVSKIFKAQKRSCQLLTAQEKLEQEDPAKREYDHKLLESSGSMVDVVDGQSIDEITGNLHKFSPTSADGSYKANSTIKFLNKSPTICKNDEVVATPAFLKAAAARRATEPDGSISKFALQLKMESQRVDSESDEYDSDLEDFIDDSGCHPAVSPDACEMLDDEHKYSDRDMDDGCMESSYSQVQHEEQISKGLGWEEDQEDMRLEAKQRNMKMDDNKEE